MKIWKRRNELLFKQSFTNPITLSLQSKQKVEELQILQKQTLTSFPLAGNPVSQWEAPPQGFYKITWDASTQKQNCISGVGVAIRDCEGNFIATRRIKISLYPDCHLDESYAAQQDVLLATIISPRKIILEGDALQVVNELEDTSENWSQAGLISMDTRILLNRFESWSFQHVKRASNENAHVLAKHALVIDDVIIELEDIPSCIGHLVST
ncbi:uncharacterized protein LOC121249390 [Juglans microcarpa x Juglans regia]|uniref:uncharacterized protein LOC121249390 n=1 Tax=Juglans microcarpa x Juglans regia TaxID=2249226 RepID=UPI001B7F526A|nr:uncharacterized protein LOC121249390 [Juglans microcarpa x Juglans regia]